MSGTGRGPASGGGVSPVGAPEESAWPEFVLREAHCHIVACGRAVWMLDLSECQRAGDVLELVRAREASLRASGADSRSVPILGQGARPEAWDPPRWPDLGELDRACAGRACALWCFDYHALMASTATLVRAGINARTPNPPGGVIGRSPGFELTGVVYEAAAGAVWSSVQDDTAPDVGAVIDGLVASTLSRAPFAEIHDLKAQPWLGPTLARGEVAEALGSRRVVLWPLLEHAEQVLAKRGAWESDRVRLGGFKIFTDGTLNSRTAHMLRAYADGRPEHPRGVAMMTPAQIESAVRRADAMGYPIAAHAIGDAAVRAVLDAIELARPKTPGFRIEHAELIDEADVPRFAQLGVIASLQPCHLLTDVEALCRGVPDRLDRVLPIRELIDSGLVPGESLVFGSDAPIVRADPRDSVWASTRRRRPQGTGAGDGACGGAIAAAQAVSEAEAWAAFRLHAPGLRG